jgi:hypothetical protein
MKTHPLPIVVASILCLAALVGPAPTLAGEGFGWTKKTVGLTRVNPPKVLLAGSRINVKASGQNQDLQGLAQQLQAQLESGLINADSRFTSDAEHPEIVIEVSVLRDNFSEDWQTRKMTRFAKVGTDEKGKAVYGPVEVQVRFKIVQSEFAISYKVVDQVKHANLDANTITLPFKQDYEEGKDAPERFSLQSTNVQNVVNLMVRRLAPTREVVSVLIPKGSLEGMAKLAEGNLWSRYLEALEGTPAKAKAEDEAYRQYALGTAYEALGYAADDPETTLKYLTKAASYYNQALESNPGEKFFSKPYDSLLTTKSAAAPVDRVKEALADYQRLKQLKEEYERLEVAKSLAATAAAKSLEEPKAAKDSAGAVDNAAILAMVESKLNDDIILTSVSSAPHCELDLSPQGLIQLSKGGASPRLIQRLQELTAKGSRPKSAKPAAGKKPAAPKG